MLTIFTILHPLVDAASVSVLWLTADGGTAFLVYNFCAFALQLPLGVLLDACPRQERVAFVSGLGLVLTGGLLALCGLKGLVVVGICCVGNALFHLTAGKLILDRTDGRSGPIGLFISTGAVGLSLGGLLATSHPVAFLLPVLTGLVVVGGVAWWRIPFETAKKGPLFARSLGAGCVVLVLLALIGWRGWVAVTAAPVGDTVPLLAMSIVVTCAGKALGGYWAERMGRLVVLAVSVCGSVLLCLGVGADAAWLWLLIVFLAQLATGPVLSLVYDRVDRSSGVAFGINCLGLFAGSL